MTAKMPPVPPKSRSPKGPQAAGRDHADRPADQATPAGQVQDPDKTGQSANTKVNTTHQGHQQDR